VLGSHLRHLLDGGTQQQLVEVYEEYAQRDLTILVVAKPDSGINDPLPFALQVALKRSYLMHHF